MSEERETTLEELKEQIKNMEKEEKLKALRKLINAEWRIKKPDEE